MHVRVMKHRAARSLVLAFAVLAAVLVPAPAHAAYGPPITVSITVKDTFGNTLATASGWVQFDDTQLTRTQYAVTLCRRSSVTSPHFGASVTGLSTAGTLFTSPYLSGYACHTYGPTEVAHSSDVRYVSFSVSNASNFNGSGIGYYSGSRSYDNPYNPVN